MKNKKLIIWSICCIILLGVIWLVAPDPSLPESVVADAEPWVNQQLESSSDLLREDSQYLLDEKEVQAIKPVQVISITLLGFIEEKEDVIAIIDVGGKSQRFKTGDVLADGSTLDAIVDHAIMLEKAGKVRMISLYQKEQ